jgi:hypothetical protein
MNSPLVLSQYVVQSFEPYRACLTLLLTATAVLGSIILLNVEQLAQQGQQNCQSERPLPCQGRGGDFYLLSKGVGAM